MPFLFALLMFVASVFLILLVLVQRGRGGGLSGAFGGMGGQSAFGAKAGDTFTKITVISATVWILLCMLATGLLGERQAKKSVFSTDAGSVVEDMANDASTNGDLDLGDVPPAPEGGGLDLGTSAEDSGADLDLGAPGGDAATGDAAAPAGDADAAATDAAATESTAPATSTESTGPASTTESTGPAAEITTEAEVEVAPGTEVVPSAESVPAGE